MFLSSKKKKGKKKKGIEKKTNFMFLSQHLLPSKPLSTDYKSSIRLSQSIQMG